MATSNPLHVLIIGSGVAGPVLAAALRKTTDYRITLVDANPENSESPIGGPYAFSPNGINALRFIGAEHIVLDNGHALEGMSVIRGDTDNTLIREKLADIFKSRFGYAVHGIQRAVFCQKLQDFIKYKDITRHYNMRLDRIEESPDSVTAHFRNGETLTADLLIGCDGIHSVTRKYVVGEDVKPRFAETSDVLGISKLSPEEDATLFQGMTIALGPGTFFGCFPCGDHTWGWFNIFPSKDPAGGEAEWNREHPSMDGHKKLVQRKLQGWKNSIPDLILSRAIRTVALGIYDRPPLPTWHRGRVVLCGDAAHPTTPIGGQGSQMVMESAVILARLLAAKGPSHATFAEYAAIRRPRTDAVTTNSRRTLFMMISGNALIQTLRDWFAWLVGPFFIRSGIRNHYSYDAGNVVLD
ncbi:hypothetical protein PIIN_03819 [Serendipita indica DSM 11827]|uniref:FAD-binding domain-containing protein n=1 Tax=Serendipita indica (strain DSM 11827) TaxID=1109443 RepID=G4TEY1_SERID|nr:hypothetical protein PIIN_03819 [Serendipita indica DSM 11827]